MKRFRSLLLIAACLILLSGCSTSEGVWPFDAFRPKKTFVIEEANMVKLMSGLTGDSVEITDSDTIQEITDRITSLSYQKHGKNDRNGYAYSIEWFDQNGKQIEFISITEENGHQISWDGCYYTVSSDLNIDVTYLKELLMK